MGPRAATALALAAAILALACLQGPEDTEGPQPSDLSLELLEAEEPGRGIQSTDKGTWVIRASWTQYSEDDFFAYRLYRAPDKDWATDTSMADCVFSTDCLTVTSFDDQSFVWERNYYYGLRTIDLSGRWAWSNVPHIYTDVDLEPCSLWVADSSGASAVLSWSGQTPPDFAGFTLFRDSLPGIEASPGDAEVVFSTTAPGVNSHEDGLCMLAADQYYALRTETESGMEAWSNEVRVRLEPVPLTVTAQVEGLAEPGYVCFTPEGEGICVAQCSPGASFVLLDAQGQVAGQLTPEGEPGCLASSPYEGRIYAATTAPDMLLALDPSDLSVLVSTELPGRVTAMQAAAADPHLYCAVYEPARLLVLQTPGLEVLANLPLEAYPLGVCEGPDGETVWATNSGNSSVLAFSKEGWDSTRVAVSAYPTGIVASQQSGMVYAASWNEDRLDIISPGAPWVQGHIETGRSPFGLAVHPDGYVYAACQLDDAVSLADLSTRTCRALITTGHGCRDVAISPDGQMAATADTEAGTVSILSFAR
ncbi:MAG: YncE family protein [Candidatus Fermentibacteraceae bacterium]